MDDTKTMTAEEVAQDVEVVSALIQNWHRTSPARIDCEASLSRIAAQAARVPGLEKQVGDLADKAAATFAAATETRKRLETRAEQAESERDAAREERDLAKLRLERDGGRLADEVAVLVRQRVVDQRSPVADALLDFRDPPATERSDRLVTLERDNASLRERVATLEHQVSRDAPLGPLVKTLRQKVREFEERDQKRRARAAAAEARVRELEAEVDRLNNRLADAYQEHVLSQPPPAPAQGVAEDVETVRGALDLLESDDVGQRTEGFAALERIAAHLSPTPPPGLPEAVAGALEDLALDFERRAKNSRAPWQAEWAASVVRAQIEKLLAAYDATGGRPEHPTPAHAQAVVTELESLLADVGEGETGRRDVVARVRLVLENAAKYRAAVELAKDKEATYRAVAASYIGVSEYSDGVEADVKDHGVEHGLRSVSHGIARYFGLTLDTPPSGPGGGEGADAEARVSACGFKPESPEDEAAFAEVMQATARRMQSHARIAPTPVPEVPPLKPTAPSVVWEQDGVRVLADGTPEMLVNATWDVAHGLCVEAIARALAEAKREVAETESVLRTLRQYQHRDESTLHETLTRLIDERSTLQNKAWMNAAESMRERAAAEAMMVWQCGGIPAVRDSASAIARAIRALPLE